MFGWINQILVVSTIEYGYYTDNQIFGWPNKICCLIQVSSLYLLFRFSRENNNFVIAVIIIIVFVCTKNVLILKIIFGSQKFVYSSGLNITLQINIENMNQWYMLG